MRKHNFINIFFVLCLVGTSSLVAHASLLDRVFSPVKDRIISEINKQIPGQITIGSISLYPPNQIVLHDVQLFKDKGQKNLIARIKKAQIYVSLLKLIYGRLSIAGITVDKPYFYLEYRNDVVNVVQALVNEQSSDENPITLSLPNIKVIAGEFKFNTDAGFDMASHGINAQGQVDIKKGVLKISVSEVRSQSGEVEPVGMYLPYTNLIGTNAIITEDWVSALKLTLLVDNSPLSAKGKVDYTNETFALSGQLSSKAKYYPKGLEPLPFLTPALNADFSLTGSFYEPIVQVNGSSGNFEAFGAQIAKSLFNARIDSRLVTVKNVRLFPLGGGEISASASYALASEELKVSAQPKNIAISSILAAFGVQTSIIGQLGGALTLEGRIFGKKQLQAQFKGALSQSQIYGLSLPAGTQVNANIAIKNNNLLVFKQVKLDGESIHIAADGNYNLLNKELSSSLSISSLNAFGLAIKDSSMKFFTAKNILHVSSASSSIGGGKANAHAQIGLDAPHKIAAELSLQNAYLTKLQINKEKLPISGKFDAQLDIQGTLNDPELQMTVKGAQITAYKVAVEKLQAVASLANNILKLSKLKARLSSGTIASQSVIVDFNKRQLEAVLQSSKVDLAQLAPLAEQQLAGSAAGTINLKGSLDAPLINAQLRIANFSWQQNTFGDGNAELSIAQNIIKMSAALKEKNASSQLRVAYNQKSQEINGELKVSQLALQTTFFGINHILKPINALVDGSVRVQGKVPLPNTTLDLQLSHIQELNEIDILSSDDVANDLMDVIIIKATLKDHNLNAQIGTQEKTKKCRQSLCAKILLNGKINSPSAFVINGSGNLSFNQMENILSFIQPDLMTAQGDLSASLRLTKLASKAQILYDGKIDAHSFSLLLPSVPEITLSKPTQIHFANDTLWLNQQALLTSNGKTLSLVGGFKQGQYHFNIDGEVPLILGKLLTPMIIGAQGSAQAHLFLEGTPQHLKPQGSVLLERGSMINFRFIPEPVIFVSGAASFSHNQQSSVLALNLNQLRAEYAEGLIYAHGQVLIDSRSLINGPINFYGPSELKLVADNIVFKAEHFWMAANVNTVLSTSTIGKTSFVGQLSVTDAFYQDKFTLENFIISRKSKIKIPYNLLPLADLALKLNVESFNAKANMVVCNIDAALTADLSIGDTTHSPSFKGSVEVVQGKIKFPQAVFDIEPSIIPVSGSIENVQAKISLSALGELSPLAFNVSENTLVQIDLKSNLDGYRLSFQPISGDKSLSSADILWRLTGPGFLLGTLTEEIERFLTGQTGGNFSLTTTTSQNTKAQRLGLDTQLAWQIGPRLVLEGTAAITSKLQFQNLRLRLLIFDHLPLGRSLALEGELLSPSSIAPYEPNQQRIKLNYRIIER